MKRVIINADDFGQDEHTFEWTVKGFESGALTSATIMAGMPFTERAVEYAKAHPEFSFGVHLCLVDEKPLSDPRKIPSMVDPKTGRLWQTRQFIVRNFLGLVKVVDIATEMRAQLEQLMGLGLIFSHVDGHGHNHRLPQSIKALVALKEKLGISRVRGCQDIPVGHMGLLGKMINRPMNRRLARHFRMCDHFAMNAGHSSSTDWFSELMKNLPEGTTEVGVHPGTNTDWRRIDTEDCFTNCGRLCTELGIEKVTFKTI